MKETDYKEIARRMHEVLAEGLCLCIETEEYYAWEARKEAYASRDSQDLEEIAIQRLFYLLLVEPVPTDSIVHCNRCEAMYIWEMESDSSQPGVSC